MIKNTLGTQNGPPNALIEEKSPYLLQHAYNPIQWLPWGAKALRQAQEQQKLILLSIGYSTCHWCHVMEKESFESLEVARVLNQNYVAIKVDREERPDIDFLYMNLAHQIGIGGGWPLNLFLTPDGIPFTGGAYYPLQDKHGRKGFLNILLELSEHWKSDPSDIHSFAEKVKGSMLQKEQKKYTADISIENILKQGWSGWMGKYESKYGGFTQSPKFPMGNVLIFLMQESWVRRSKKSLQQLENTLDQIASGGIYDRIGGGVHRCSTDNAWLVPHFEKMLYDQALLIQAYVLGWKLFSKQQYLKVIGQIVVYVQQKLLSPKGGFYSAEDADSEGMEGRFYLWSKEELIKLFGKREGQLLSQWYGVTEKGNFEGANILTERVSPELLNVGFEKEVSGKKESFDTWIEKCRVKMFAYREKRVHPHVDEKIMVDWNGLVISSLSEVSQILTGIKSEIVTARLCRDLAVQCAEFLLENLQSKEGLLNKSYRGSPSAHLGFLEDYAFFISGLIDLYEATFEWKYLEQAKVFTDSMIQQFWDEKQGGFFCIGKAGEPLIQNPKNIYDCVTPNGNGVAALALVHLERYFSNPHYQDLFYTMIRSFGKDINNNPSGCTSMLQALEWYHRKVYELVLVIPASIGEPNTAEERRALLEDPEVMEWFQVIHSNVLSRRVLFLHTVGEDEEGMHEKVPFLRELKPVQEKITLYVCEQFSCKDSVTKLEEAKKILDKISIR